MKLRAKKEIRSQTRQFNTSYWKV